MNETGLIDAQMAGYTEAGIIILLVLAASGLIYWIANR